MNTQIHFQTCEMIGGNPNRLRICDSGRCLAYLPKVIGSSSFKPHITLDFGSSVLMLDLEDFKKFAAQVLSIKHDDNIVPLRLVK